MNIKNFITDIIDSKELVDSSSLDIANVIRSRLYYTYNIKCTIENDSERKKKKKRMIIYFDRININDNEKPITRESHGIIIDISTWKIICTPQLGFMNVYGRDLKKIGVITELQKGNVYTQYKINDGTTVNLYWWNPDDSDAKWVISTKRGIEVNDLVWQGLNTYEVILNGVLSQYDKFSWDKLDKKRTYTVGFYHPQYHPFQSLNKLPHGWFIQSVNNESGEISLKEDIGIPMQEIVSESLNDLFLMCNNELTKYQRFMESPVHIPQNAKTHEIELKTNKPNWNGLRDKVSEHLEYDPWFGFILKSNDVDKTGNYSHIMCESSLYAKIKQLMYSGKHRKITRQYNYDRTSYILIKSYLDTNIHTDDLIFLTLFPQYVKVFDGFTRLISHIAHGISICLTNSSKIKLLQCSSFPIDKLTYLLYVNICEYFQSRPFDSRKAMKIEIVKYILDDRFIDYYYLLFRREYKKITETDIILPTSTLYFAS